jgi:hypothetical protein
MKKNFKHLKDNIEKGINIIPDDIKIRPSVEEGLNEEETRATFIIKKELLEKVKDIAYWERVRIKDVINLALEKVVKKYDKNNQRKLKRNILK